LSNHILRVVIGTDKPDQNKTTIILLYDARLVL